MPSERRPAGEPLTLIMSLASGQKIETLFDSGLLEHLAFLAFFPLLEEVYAFSRGIERLVNALCTTTSSHEPSGNRHMTANDFFLLSIAFGGFVFAPALILWGFARITYQNQDRKRGPDIRPDVDSPGASNGDALKETAPSGGQRTSFVASPA